MRLSFAEGGKLLERLSDIARGYAVIKAVGAEPTAIIDRCAAQGIEFWGVSPEDSFTLVFKTRLGQAEIVTGFAEKCCCEAEVLENCGLPVEAKKLKNRYALWLLPFALFALLVASSLFIWKIDISGNETVTDIEILNALEDSGVYIGSFSPRFVSDNIRSRVLIRVPELKWISVSVFGSRAVVEVRERTEIPELDDKHEPIKIVAEQSGIIQEMSVLRGFPLFSKGQTAVENDTLITGAVPSSFSETEIVHAGGSVSARTWYEITAIMPLEYTEKVYTGKEKTRFALIVGNDRINFYAKSRILDVNCDNIIKKQRLGIDGFFELPLIFVKETVKEYELSTASAFEDSAKARIEESLNDELKAKIGEDGEIKSSEYTFSVLDGFAVGTLRAECRQNIAAEEEMTAEEISAAKSAGEEQDSQ